MIESAIQLKDVHKHFGKTHALQGIDLELNAGNIIGLLGRNGCGKTTLLSLVAGLYPADKGTCLTLGSDAARLTSRDLSRIGMVPQDIRFLDWLTVESQLKFIGGYYTSWDSALQTKLTHALELDPKARVGNLSPGNKQKLAIIAAFCHHPDLVLLDEPVSALDPVSRGQFLEFLFDQVSADGSTVVISSHVLHDVERLVNWVVCLDQGRLKISEDLDSLKERYAYWQVRSNELELKVDTFSEDYICNRKTHNRSVQLLVEGVDENSREQFRRKYNVEVESRPLNLEALFPIISGKGK